MNMFWRTACDVKGKPMGDGCESRGKIVELGRPWETIHQNFKIMSIEEPPCGQRYDGKLRIS